MRNLIASGVALLAIGCSSLLGLNDFEDAPAVAGAGGVAGGPAGGAGGTAGSGGMAGAAGAGGSAGAGGTAGLTCNPVSGAPDVLLTAADLGGFSLQPSSLVAISGTEHAHFGIIGDDGNGNHKFFVRSVRQSGGGWLDNLATFDLPQVSSGSIRLEQGASAPQGPFAVWGYIGQSVTRLTFQTQGNGVQPGSGKLDSLPTPMACTTAQSGYPDGAAFSPQPNGTLRYAVSCRQNDTKVSLFVVDNGGNPPTPIFVDEKTYPGKAGEDLRAESYAFVKGQHVVMLGEGAVRYGADATQLAKGTWKLTNEAGLFSVGLFAVPTPDQSAALFIAAAVDFNGFSKGEVYSGVVAPPDWPKLFQTPSPVMAQAASLTNGQEFPMLETWAADADTIVMAANDLSGANLRFWHVSRTGKLNVVNEVIYTVKDSSTTKVTRGSAARAGAHYYATWVEEEGGSPARLLGKGVICTGQL